MVARKVFWLNIMLNSTDKYLQSCKNEFWKNVFKAELDYILQQLKAKYIENGGELSLNEKISKAHHAYPCNASMDQDSILKDSCLHVAGYLVRNAIRRELNLEEEEGQKLVYVVK